MCIKVTTESFIKRANILHGFRYDYSKSVYVKSRQCVEIICHIHGSFFQEPNSHLSGGGCPKCGIEKTRLQLQLSTEDFIKRSKKTHKGKYCYDKVLYRGCEKKIVIGCPEHGFFEQRPIEHMSGQGCPKCGRKSAVEKWKKPLADFISASNKKFNGRYDYSKVVYKNNRTKVIVVCPNHGEFLVSPDNHERGSGCQECQREVEQKAYQEYFIKKAKEIHSDFYDYSESVFIRCRDNVKILCPRHGAFFQIAEIHMRGAGCPRCILKQESKLEEIIRGTFKNWKIERHKRLFSKDHGRNRIFDFYLTKSPVKLIIEYDGKQHFEPVRFSNVMSQDRANLKFEAQKETDRLDRVFCEKEGIVLCRVSYKDDMVKILGELFSLFI